MNKEIVAPLRGWVSVFYQSYKGHRLGPYYARSWKDNGKLKRQYIKPSEVERTRAACQAYREKRKTQTECAQRLTRLTGNLNYINRMAKRADKAPLRSQDYAFLNQIETRGYDIPGRPALRSQSTIGNRQPKTFMYPSSTKSSLNAKRSTLNAIRATLLRPKFEKLKAEPPKDKIQRWQNEMNAIPQIPTNAQYRLPDWITRDEIHNFVARCVACKRQPTDPGPWLEMYENQPPGQESEAMPK